MENYKKKEPFELAIEVSNSFDTVVQYIKKQLACPLPVRESEKYYSLRYKLIGLWRITAKRFCVDREWYYIHEEEEEQDFELNEELLSTLQQVAINIANWIERAREEFFTLTKPIQCIVADEDIYAKHILRKPLPLDKMITLCLKKKSSFLFPKLTSNQILDILLNATEYLFEGIIQSKNLRISVICDENVGVTDKGEVTNCLLIEINADKETAHAYPCSHLEAKNNIKEFKLRERDKYDYYYFGDDDEEKDSIEHTYKFTTTYFFKNR